jgi:Domain of unknown function (DUF4386)
MVVRQLVSLSERTASWRRRNRARLRQLTNGAWEPASRFRTSRAPALALITRTGGLGVRRQLGEPGDRRAPGGEHLGYLLTGAWTIFTSLLILGGTVLPVWLGWLGLPIGIAQLVGSLEFVGPNERDGWKVAERLVPVAYIAWSLWLIVSGITLLL